MESRFISIPAGKIHVQVAGMGEALLLIHGYSPQMNSWRTWRKNIDTLAQTYRVYALDLLGYGESDKPARASDVEFQTQALVALLDAEKIERVTLIGLSWGGAMAQRLAARVPTRVRKLVLVDSATDSASLEVLRAQWLPTLIMWDEEDGVIPVARAYALACALPQARLRILTRAERDPDANPENRHWSQETHSQGWNRIVREFLKE